MTEPVISVIVPVYNAEKYLRQCVDSILAQTYSDFEILLINDGSSDESQFICDEYAEKDTRVYVFHKENGGVSSARNLGLDNAKGRWICFVDSDDWLDDRYLETFFAQEQFCDLTNYSCRILDQGRSYEHHLSDTVETDKCDIERLMQITMRTDGLDFLCVPWAKFYKKSIIEKYRLRFNPEIRFREDEIFVTNYCMHISSFETNSKIFYNFRKSQKSLSTIKRGFYDNFKLGISILERAKQFATDEMQNFMKERAWLYLFASFGQARSFNERHKSYSQCYENRKELINGNFHVTPKLTKILVIGNPIIRKLGLLIYLCLKQLRNGKYNCIDV